jgi:hypothetical protein
MDHKRSCADDTESAIAYGLLFVVVFIIAASITAVAVFEMENSLLDIINTFIAQGTVSSKTASAISFSRNIGMALPLIALGGCFLWSMNRGVQSRDNQTISGGAFWTGWIVLVLCCVVGFIMSFTGGIIIDSLWTGIDLAGGLNNPTMMTQEWADTQMNTVFIYINAYYALCYLVPCIGVFVFATSIVRRTVGSRYDYYGGGGF